MFKLSIFSSPKKKFSSKAKVASSVIVAASLTLTACATGEDSNSSSSSTAAASQSASQSATAENGKIVIQDARGSVEIPDDPKSIVATDNHVFRTLDAWNVPLTAAAVTLMPDDVSYKKNKDVVDLGSHREPNLEKLVAVKPDLIFNGNRYQSQYDEMKKLVPDAALVDTGLDENKPLNEELKRLTTLLGTALKHEDDAKKLNEKLDDAIKDAKDAYDALPSDGKSVMGVITSGGNIGYAAPHAGRDIGPLYDMVGMTPSLESSGSDNHKGDDISIEAIAQSNPEWIIVMDRDAAVKHGDTSQYTGAKELIEQSEALKNVPAVQKGHIIYLPDNFYLTADIQAYTQLLEDMAKAFKEGKDSK